MKKSYRLWFCFGSENTKQAIIPVFLTRICSRSVKNQETAGGFVIFITENAVIGGGLPISTIDRQITNMDQPFDDGEHIIYVNGANRDASNRINSKTQPKYSVALFTLFKLFFFDLLYKFFFQISHRMENT